MAKTKAKTHKGTTKRIWITGTGKLMHKSAFQKKHHAAKSSSHLRRIRTDKQLTGAAVKEIRKLLKGANLK